MGLPSLKNCFPLSIDGEKLFLDVSNTYRANKAICMQVITGEYEPYTTLSVCLPEASLGQNCTYFDNNNNPESILDLLIKQGIAERTGRVGRSGFCTYPEIRILKHCP